jgi:hypothetical protein
LRGLKGVNSKLANEIPSQKINEKENVYWSRRELNRFKNFTKEKLKKYPTMTFNKINMEAYMVYQ